MADALDGESQRVPCSSSSASKLGGPFSHTMTTSSLSEHDRHVPVRRGLATLSEQVRRRPATPHAPVVDVLAVLSVAIDGPYGAFTANDRTSDSVLLFGAGVGTTPIRALLQELPQTVAVVAVLRASTAANRAVRAEIVKDVNRRQGLVYELAGPREGVDQSTSGLLRIVPDVARRDVFICGPDDFTTSIVAAARDAGVPLEQIHYETCDMST